MWCAGDLAGGPVLGQLARFLVSFGRLHDGAGAVQLPLAAPRAASQAAAVYCQKGGCIMKTGLLTVLSCLLIAAAAQAAPPLPADPGAARAVQNYLRQSQTE